MYHDELIELSYPEFVNAVATAKSKKAMHVRLTDKEKYLLKHAVSIELAILEMEEHPVAYSSTRHGVSDGVNDEELISSYFAHVGASHDVCPSTLW